MKRGRTHARAVAAFAALGFLLLAATPAWAHTANTTTTLSFSENPTTAGTVVTITGTVEFDGTFGGGPSHTEPSAGDPVVGATVQIQMLQFDSEPNGSGDGTAFARECATGDVAVFEIIASGPADGSGQFGTLFDTTGHDGESICFKANHPSSGGQHGSGQSDSQADLIVQAGAEEVDPISIVKTRTEGPLDRDGSLIDPVDSQNLTVTGADAGGIWIGLDEPQRYVFTIKITNNTGETLDDLTVTDVVPAEYNLDPVLQEDADDGIDATCDDATCDGEDAGTACDDPSTGATETECAGFKSDVSACMVAATQPEGADAGPKGEMPLGQRFKEPELLTIMVDGLADQAMCTVTVYVITDGNPGHVTKDGGDEQCHPDIASFFDDPETLEECDPPDGIQILAFDLYEPGSCDQIKTVDHEGEGTDEIPINDTMALNDGVKAFLVEGPNESPVYHGARQFGPSSSLQLTVNGCDADEDGVQDIEDACPLTGPETDQIDPEGDGCWVDPPS